MSGIPSYENNSDLSSLRNRKRWIMVSLVLIFVVIFPISVSGLVKSLKRKTIQITTPLCESAGLVESLLGTGIQRTFTAQDCGKTFLLNLAGTNIFYIPAISGWTATFRPITTSMGLVYIRTSPGAKYSGFLNFRTSGELANTIPSGTETQITSCGTPTLNDVLNIIVKTPNDTFAYGYAETSFYTWDSNC